MAEADQEKRRAKLQELRERRGGRRRVPAQQASEDADGARPGGGLMRMIAKRRGQGGDGPLAGNRPGLGGGLRNRAGGGDGQQDRPLLRQLLAKRRGGQGDDEGMTRLRERLGTGDPEKLREKIEQRIEKLRGLIKELDEREDERDEPNEETTAVSASTSGAPEARKSAKKT